MLCADDGGVVPGSVENLAEMKTAIASVFEEEGFKVPETKTDAPLLQTPNQTLLTNAIHS